MSNTPPTGTTAPPAQPTLVELVNQAETDLATFQTAKQTAATSAAQAQTDAANANDAQARVHTDFVNIGLAIAQVDPGAPGVPAAMAAMRKYASLRHV